ncbi:MAG: energy-converting NiFe hydrogenase A subunit EhaA, partial [Methanobacterium sp.]|nr:energy-converting NiFe hydrogenase A subunit EhaA [Methanobacterium sp.]
AVLALGFTAMVAQLGYLTNSNMDYIIGLTIGILTAFFSKFILEKILPRPAIPDDTSEINEPVEKPPEESEPSENLHKKSSSTEKSQKKKTSEKPSEESGEKSENTKPDKSSKSLEESHG